MHRIFADWAIESQSGVPAYKQIVHRVQAAVAAGQLGEGDQLPTIRTLHQHLGLNPNTVAKAYRELEHGGVISTARGSGSFVASAVPTPPLSSQEKHTKLNDLVARFVGEARSYGIPMEELLQFMAAAHGRA